MEFVEAKTEDNLILQGILFKPKKVTDKVILHIHGMSGNFWENSFIKVMAKEYPNKGLSFLTIELRGSEILRWFIKTDGTMQLIGNAYEIFEDSIKDIATWINFLKSKGYKQVHLQGHSLGCAKIAYFKSNVNERLLKSLILISPSDIIGLVLEPTTLKQHQKMLSEAQNLNKQGKGNQLLSETLWGYTFLSANTYLNFFQETSKTAIFNYFKPSLGFDTIKKINIPILAILGTKDDGIVTDPQKSLDTIKDNAINCPKFIGKVFQDAKHSYEGFEKRIIESVIDFIKI